MGGGPSTDSSQEPPVGSTRPEETLRPSGIFGAPPASIAPGSHALTASWSTGRSAPPPDEDASEVAPPPRRKTLAGFGGPQGCFGLDALDAIIDKVDGVMAAALVDYETSIVLGMRRCVDDFDVDSAAHAQVAVLRAELDVIHRLGLSDGLHDLLISLESQYHLIRPVQGERTYFLYVVIDRANGNLALARHHVAQAESTLR